MTAKFWVGGTGTWDNSTTTHWSLSTGGAGGAAVPVTGDAVTFDASSGAGTVTASATITGLSLASITCGVMGMTLDFSANNPSLTLTAAPGFSVTGAGTRTINMGSGTFTFSGSNGNVWDATTITGLTLSAASATFLIAAPGASSPQTFVGGGQSYGTLQITGRANLSIFTITGSNTFANLTVPTGPVDINIPGGTTTTITNAISWNLSSSTIALIMATGTSAATLAVAVGSVISWAALRGLTFTGTTVVATNSFNLSNNTGVTITAPAGAGAGAVIGS